MSGIAGLFGLDGAPARPDGLRQMVTAIAHRGPDGTAVWTDGPVGLGHAAHHTTPEARFETWPLADPESQIVLVADARIDNREELIRRLRPRPTPDGVVTDALLIRAAYERWGTKCAVHLIGDVAFALWDPDAQRLFCVRDAMGVRPLFYAYHPGRSFAFGSEIKALLALPAVSQSVDEDRVADYLSSTITDAEATFYRDIRRLLPGYALEVTPDGLRTWAYWELDPEKGVVLPSDEAYAEAFLERFDDAVRCRLRSSASVGAYLSGGLDSSSIAVTARDLRREEGRGTVPTFSTVYDRFPSCDEREYIHAVLDQGVFDPHFFLGDDVRVLGCMDALLDVHDEPFFAPNLAKRWSELSRIRERGVSVLLGGHGGDEVVSKGFGRLHDLARSGQWLTLAQETRGVSRIHGEGTGARLWGAFAWHYGVHPWLEGHPWAQRIHGWMCQARRRLVPGHGHSALEAEPRSLLGPRFHAQHPPDASSRRRPPEHEWAKNGRTRAQHYADLTDPMQGVALEILDRTVRAQGMELRLPFLDRRLVEFCLALPAEQKRRHGWGRYVLRRAMAGRLPDTIRRRHSKTDFAGHFAARLSSERMSLRALLLDGRTPDSGYIDREVVKDLLDRLDEGGPTTPAPVAFQLWRCAVVATWLHGPRSSEEFGPAARTPEVLSG